MPRARNGGSAFATPRKPSTRRAGGDFRKDETLYRAGFDAAFRRPGEAPLWETAHPLLRERHGPVAEEPAFRAGYARGRAYRSRSQG